MNEIFHSGAWHSDHLNVYTGGTFDLFHRGHVNFLLQCRMLANGGKVTVGLNTDEFAESYKRKPVCNLAERIAVVEACRYVDDVAVNWGGGDSKPLIEHVAPDVIAVGDDWRDKDYYGQMGFTQEWLDERGIQVIFLPYTKGVSSSDIISRLK